MAEPHHPRLLVLASTYPRWAKDPIPGFVHELSKRLTDRFEVTVLAPHDPGAAEHELMEGVEVHRFRYAPEKLERLAYGGGMPSNLKRHPWLLLVLPWFITAQFVAAYKLMRRIAPDVVHTHWLLPSGLIGALLQELPGARFRLVVTAHGSDVHLRGNLISRMLKREVLRSADLVTVVSRSLRDKLHETLGSIPVEVAPMGVDLRSRFVPEEATVDTPKLVFAGRLADVKGVDDLLNALPRILVRFPNTKLLIAGDGPMAPELHRRCERLALRDAVEFLGSVPNERLPALFRSAQLVTLPFKIGKAGDQEGLGLVTIEAMGCGVPVLAGNVAALSDVVAHNRNGWLVSSGDPAAIAEGVVTLLQDPKLRQRLATQARADVLAAFDWSVAAERYRDLLQFGNRRQPPQMLN